MHALNHFKAIDQVHHSSLVVHQKTAIKLWTLLQWQIYRPYACADAQPSTSKQLTAGAPAMSCNLLNTDGPRQSCMQHEAKWRHYTVPAQLHMRVLMSVNHYNNDT